MLRAFGLAMIIFSLSAAARAQSSPKLHSDAGGMPRCFDRGHGSDGVLFVWDDSSGYGRDVQAIPLPQALELWAGNDLAPKNCSQWHSLLANRMTAGNADGLLIAVSPDAESVLNVPLSQDVRDALAEVRMGADVYHPEKTGAEFLAHHPIADYDRSVNRDLTRKYGQGFSGQIYKAWVEAKPENAAFKSRVMQKVASFESGQTKLHQIADRLAPYTLVLAPGYMQPIEQGRASDMLHDLASIGVPVTTLNVSPMGSIATNIDLFKSQLRPLLLGGKKLIIMGLSKGMPEILTASTRLLQDPQVKASQGRLAGVLSLSGMFDGAFTVDWTKAFPQSIASGILLKNVLYAEAKQLNITDRTLDGFKSMSSKSVASYTAENLSSLPADVPVVCVIGVIPGDGTANDPSIKTLQDRFVKPYLSRSGGNDGYVEYPGTCLPRAARGNNVSEIVFDSSHVFLDGKFMGRDLSQTTDRSNTMVSILDALVSQIKAN